MIELLKRAVEDLGRRLWLRCMTIEANKLSKLAIKTKIQDLKVKSMVERYNELYGNKIKTQ